MNFKNESEFNRWWTDQLRKRGALVIVLAGGNQFQQSGLPDRLVIHKRFFGFVEGKKDDGKLSSAQRVMLRSVNERGQPALVLRLRGDEMLVEDHSGLAMARGTLKDDVLGLLESAL